MNRFATLVARGVADQFSPRHRASALRRLRTTPAPVRRGLHLLPVAFLAILASTVCAQNTNVFELRDGDRVVFLGDTFFEREQTYGHIEYLLTTHYPERHVTFRNLGWSADTPLGLSRSGFGFPTEGLHRLRTNDLVLAKPTVAFLSYGMTASFAGAAGLSNFVAEMEKLMDLVQEAAGTNPVRFVLLSPIRHERHPPPMPDPARHNEDLQRYTDALRQLAGRRQAHFVNLFEALNPRNFPPGLPPLTDDGIHLTEHGYRRAAEAIGAAFRWESHIWRVGILANGQVREGSFGVTVHELSRTTNSARLVATLEQLVPPPDPALTRSNRFGSSPGRV
ncbi:MAG TPA: SGNH/GDSL hydrolase family protein, partial [Methylomirabilota bacterium]|nr:SGNH/GDSL hydrolase family protein [Methylomirabilota bacterium]